ncbi:MAG: uridine kinase, partial [Eubacteriales bacterium]|nr:uridine kinase [Eubacteriales bacterium]
MRDEAWYKELDAEIGLLLESGLERIVLAIDGSSAAGKSSLAAELGEKYDAHVFHIDDYFLTDEQRTEERLAAVGEFFDKERVLTEVLEPLRGGEDVLLCRRFNCATQGFSEAESVGRKRVYIIGGVYSLHPDL